MSANAPWSVKGIDPQAREIAKDLARRSGQTLGEWINSMIIEGGKGDAPAAAPPEREPVREPAREPARAARDPQREERRPQREPAYADAREAFYGAYREPDLDREDERYPEPRSRRATASLYPEPTPRRRFDFDDLGADELTRVARAVERLAARVDQSDQRTTLAVSSVDQSVAGVLTRLEMIERDQTATVGRVESLLGRLEHDDTGPRQAEAVRGLESALGKIAVQLFEGEQRNASSFADLRQGLAGVERKTDEVAARILGDVRESLSEADHRTRAALGEVREEMKGAEHRTRAAFAVLREEITEGDSRARTAAEALQVQIEVNETGARAALEQVRAELRDQLDRSASGTEQTLGGFRADIEGIDARTRQSVDELKGRVERAEQRHAAAPLLPPRPVLEPGVLVEQVVARVTERLGQAETKTGAALRTLESSFAALDQRLQAAEANLDPQVAAELEQQVGARFEHLAAELTGQMEAARLEMADRLTEVADNRRLDELEASLRELQRHAEAAERRQSDAIERMGREVMRVTEALNSRVAGVEVQTNETVQQVAEALSLRVVDLESQLAAQTGEALSRATESLGAQVAGLEARVGEAAAQASETAAQMGEAVARATRATEPLNARLAALETQTQDAVARTAETLGSRLDEVRAGVGQTVSQATEALAARVDEAVARTHEAVQRSNETLGGRLSNVEAQLGEGLASNAEALHARIDEVETHTGEAVERVVGIVEARLLRSDETQAGALERLGGEMARISERLADRVDSAERRSAEAIEEVGDKVAEVSERLNQRYERAAAGLAERMRESEERLARVLEETRERLDARLGEAQRGLMDHIEHRVVESERGLTDRFDTRVAHTERGLADRLEQRVGETQRELAETLSARVGETERGLVSQLEQRVGQTHRELAQSLDARVGETHRELAQSLDARVGETERGLVSQLEARVGETQRELAQSLDARVGETERGLVSQLEARVGETQRELAQSLDARVGETERGLVSQLEARVGETHRGLAQALDERVGETERGLSDRLQRTLAEAERVSAQTAAPARPEPSLGIADQLDRRLGQTEQDASSRLQASLAQISSRIDQVSFEDLDEPVLSPTVFASPPVELTAAPVVSDPEEALAPFAAFADADGFRHAPLELDDPFVPPALAVSGPAEAEALDEPEPPLPVTTVVVDAPVLDDDAGFSTPPTGVHAISDDGFGADFDVDDEFVTATPAGPQAQAQAEVEPAEEAQVAAAAEEWSFDIEPLELEAPANPVVAELTPEPPAPVSPTRRMLEDARAAARAASDDGKSGRKSKAVDLGPPPPMTGLGGSRLRAPSLGGFMARLGRKKDDKEGSGVRTTALVAGVSFAVSAMAGGAWLMYGDGKAADAGPADAQVAKAGSGEQGAAPLAASLVVPAGSVSAAPAPAPINPDGTLLYASAVRALQAGQSEQGLADLRRAADGGHAPAQLYLADLYNKGRGGLPRDLAQARRWTASAAQLGNRTAMHNLAMSYVEGEGGPTDYAAAAQWFRRAADQGLTDSQYNLGYLFEQGRGVPANPGEAYKWYLIASRLGADQEARASAERLRPTLSPVVQATAERNALAFRPAAPAAPSAAVAAPAAPAASSALVIAQERLSQLGYYRGPRDGAPSPALTRALAAWQASAGLEPTGAPNPETMQRLAAAG